MKAHTPKTIKKLASSDEYNFNSISVEIINYLKDESGYDQDEVDVKLFFKAKSQGLGCGRCNGYTQKHLKYVSMVERKQASIPSPKCDGERLSCYKCISCSL